MAIEKKKSCKRAATPHLEATSAPLSQERMQQQKKKKKKHDSRTVLFLLLVWSGAQRERGANTVTRHTIGKVGRRRQKQTKKINHTHPCIYTVLLDTTLLQRLPSAAISSSCRVVSCRVQCFVGRGRGHTTVTPQTFGATRESIPRPNAQARRILEVCRELAAPRLPPRPHAADRFHRASLCLQQGPSARQTTTTMGHSS